MYYNGQNTSIQERLQSLGGVYPQQAMSLDQLVWIPGSHA